MSFRKKIVVFQIFSTLILFILLFPLINKGVSSLVKDSFIEVTSGIKKYLEQAKTEEELIELAKKKETQTFYRLNIINDKGTVIFDTHNDRVFEEKFQPYSLPLKKEVEKAKKSGVGYQIAISDTFQVRFAYVAETFQFQNQTYIIRTAFPYQQIEDLTTNFRIATLILFFIFLCFFNALILFIFSRLIIPIREIICTIRSSTEESEIPKIIISNLRKRPKEFQLLVDAFNELSRRIEEKIEDIKNERNEKEAILESLGEGVVAVDKDMIVQYVNQTACKMLGMNRTQLLGESLKADEKKINLELLQKVRELLEFCQKEGNIATDSHIFGEQNYTYIDLVAVPKAEGEGAIIVIQDKTQKYRVLEMGKDFVANASHELRTPITIIRGYAETLHDFPDLTKAQNIEIVEKITRNCERMESLVRSLLLLADIENISEESFVETDLIKVIEKCQHILKSIYTQSELTINSPKETILIKADPSLLELAFTNLFDNAAKYSEPPEKIQVTIEFGMNEEVIIRITDQGKGIPEEDIEHIFQRFYRVDKTHSRKFGGAGLGLSIVKTVVFKHRGVIEVSSILCKGSTFTIKLPGILNLK